MGPIIAIVFNLIIAAVVLLIVSRFNLGLKVAGFGPAIIAAAVIAIVAGIVSWLLGLLGLYPNTATLWNAFWALVVAAVVLLVGDRFLPGLEVRGFKGALIAAIAIGVVSAIILAILGALGIAA
jgi:putative membrane protein